MRNNRKNLFLCAAAAAVLVTGCGRLDRVDQTTVYADPDNGVIQEAIVEAYAEEDTYSESELKAFVEEDAAAYNEETGEESVTVSGVNISKDQVEIRLRYSDCEQYAGYHRTDFFAGTLAQAQEKGYDFSGTFLDAEGTETTISEVLSEHPDYHVVIFEVTDPDPDRIAGVVRFFQRDHHVGDDSRSDRGKYQSGGRRCDF